MSSGIGKRAPICRWRRFEIVFGTSRMQAFLDELCAITDDEALLDFCRRRMLHGTPTVFEGREQEFYAFRKRIADAFEVHYNEVLITGSAKLGFSPFKLKLFDYDSDIDVAIISDRLYERIMDWIHGYQLELRENRKVVSERELKAYHNFLEYGAMGWMRPDLLPTSFQVKDLKDGWFDFFRSISFGACEVGNYKVNAGVFKTHAHLEKYTISGLRSVRTRIQARKIDAITDQAQRN